MTTPIEPVNGLDPNISYQFTVKCKDKCGKVLNSETTDHSCTTICILPGATVLTPNGKKLIDNIKAGDIVIDENTHRGLDIIRANKSFRTFNKAIWSLLKEYEKKCKK